MSTSSFSQMPLHLIGRMLLELDSIQSLGAAILSHSSFLGAFNEQRVPIMIRVLENQIPPDLMRYAMATCKAALRGAGVLPEYPAARNPRRRRRTPKFQISSTIEEVTLAYPGRERHSGDLKHMFDWYYSHAVAQSVTLLSRTHVLVEHFTRRFLSEVLPLAKMIYGARPPGSYEETFRIQRALYRFQLYCHLVGFPHNEFETESGHEEEYTDPSAWKHWPFFGLYSPWANEQLACIHDFLEHVVSKGQHDINSRCSY